MGILDTILGLFGARTVPTPALPGESMPYLTTEIGRRATPENSLKYAYRLMWVDPDLRQTILDIRAMDRRDGRVKKIHGRMARTATKGGLQLWWIGAEDDKITRLWRDFRNRLTLHRQEKLESDCRGLVMEGNLPMQWILDFGQPQVSIIDCVRMPAETILPLVDATGRFKNNAEAYSQIDASTGQPLAKFGLWQLSMVRLTPDSYDDQGALGRPYLDAQRSVWRKLMMTEEDMVIRRRQRAPLRMAHILEGATDEQLKAYRDGVERDQTQITTDFYLNRKGAVQAVQGDANLDQIGDVSYLLDTFFAGAAAPKGLFGYSGDLSRDILEELRQDYFDEIDSLQDTLSFVYLLGFRLELLLRGINPDAYDFSIEFAERRTETPSQAADRALKYQAIGVPPSLVWETAGLDPAQVRARQEEEAQRHDPYPGQTDPGGGMPTVNITPGNAPMGQSATTISTRS